MLVTEEQAKTKLCQETLQPIATADRVAHEGQNCVASACMAWRWGQNADRSLTKVGYCGKGGRP